MYKRTSTPARKDNVSSTKYRLRSKQVQANEFVENMANVTQINQLLNQGKNMGDDEFEKFIKIHASDCYWKILAERARIQLEEQIRENRQLHELFHELNKENQQLQIKNEQCQYLTNVFNSIISEYDSGIELHSNDDSAKI